MWVYLLSHQLERQNHLSEQEKPKVEALVVFFVFKFYLSHVFFFYIDQIALA